MAKKLKEKAEESKAKRLEPIKKMEAVVPGKTSAPKGVYSTESIDPTPVVGKAEVQNPTGITNPAVEAAKPKTLSELLADQRKAAVKDKTDAAKMQKYYALTDAFSALGKMGGAAVGGAIGGNMLDSAPIVADYQPSRGYLDAFEKAKQANDRIRALDDRSFQLAYNKQQRDEERAYAEQKAKEDREYRKEIMMLEHKLRKAEREEDRKAEEEAKMRILEVTQAHEEKLKRMSVGMVNTQMSGKKKDGEEDSIPFTFQNLTKVNIPKNLYPEMLNWALTLEQVGDDIIDEDNVETVLRKHPELVNSFLNVYGFGTKPEVTSEADEENVSTAYSASSPSNGNVTSIPNISIMHDSPNLVRRMDERNQKIAQKQAVKNNRVQELMDAGYTEQEAKRKERVERRVAKAAAKYGYNSAEQSDNQEQETTGSDMTIKDFENKWG